MKDATRHSKRVVVIGYGNSLRGDDGLGPAVVARIDALRWPGVRTRALLQLTPELAEELAQADVAIFVDASHEPTHGVRVRRVQERDDESGFTHFADVPSMLRLTRMIFGRAPRAWIVSVAGGDFSVREGLSDGVTSRLDDLIQKIADLACTSLAGDIGVPDLTVG